MATEAYAASFGFEWNRHRQTQLDSRTGRSDSRDTFAARMGLGRSDLDGRLVLDAGTGVGRFAEVAAGLGGRVVAVDLSRAVDLAAENLGDQALVAQADVFRLPFADGTFDVVFSIGVLHHTPDPSAGLAALARVVRPGGTVAVSVYERAAWYRMADLYRVLTTRLDRRTLYRLSRGLARLHAIHRLPVVGRAVRFLVPVSGHPVYDWRVLDTFNWYAPRYQSKHTFAEVVGWFRALGFEAIETRRPSVAVRGRRPMNAAGESAAPGLSRIAGETTPVGETAPPVPASPA
ncbi:MAG TPA: class I SAM-dependent methyltransferase [Candidatus Limnocylindrales bacterium]|nr:class I SAM-dependent methyltransferase [Candidatus Limnocylindrales bacterium]